MAAHVLGATVVHYPLGRASEAWSAPSREALEALATPRTKLVVVNSPSNPTGSVFSREELQRFVDFVGDRPGAALLSDEIYGGVCFSNGGGSAPSVFDCDLGAAEGRVVACAGVSKEFAMTGFRVGWLASKGPALAAAEKLMEPLVSCGVPFAQAGAEAALRSSDARAYAASMRDAYRARRDVALGVLGARGASSTSRPARSIRSWTWAATPSPSPGSCSRTGASPSRPARFGAPTAHHVRVSLCAARATPRGLERLCAYVDSTV
ncbi:transferase [Aureococcus anophagefferens]|nr:transferase [Aureococcus anophagefferens]